MITDLAAFERLYRTHRDPWDFEASPYETARYATIDEWVGPGPFARAFEPACSIGVLTARLAPRCAELIGCEASATACAAARERTGRMPNVQVVHAEVPDWWPEPPFDLVVLSELGYYWDPAGVAGLARRTLDVLAPRAVVVAAHWLGRSADHVQHGSAVHDQLELVLGAADARADVDPSGAGDEATTFTIERWTIG